MRGLSVPCLGQPEEDEEEDEGAYPCEAVLHGSPGLLWGRGPERSGGQRDSFERGRQWYTHSGVLLEQTSDNRGKSWPSK